MALSNEVPDARTNRPSASREFGRKAVFHPHNPNETAAMAKTANAFSVPFPFSIINRLG
jgi:hypothetical protein